MKGISTLGRTTGHRESERRALLALIESDGITPWFQPIVDLQNCVVVGYEVLSRGQGDLTSPLRMFDLAAETGLSWDLEQACRNAAFRKIASLTQDHRRLKFFINVSPHILLDTRFTSGFTLTSLESCKLPQHQIVMEITERDLIPDLDEFKSLVDHYVRQGFNVALDDFGSGESGLLTLINCAPNFIKLDKDVVRGIHTSSYRQHLVKSLISFCVAVDARLIAEGVETEEEMACLLRLGVHYAQGYLIARPAPEPPQPSEISVTQILGFHQGDTTNQCDPSESVQAIVVRCDTMPARRHTGRDLDLLFRDNPRLDHIVVEDHGRPLGLISRRAYYSHTSGPVGYSLHYNRPLEMMLSPNQIMVEEHLPITDLARIAMERKREEIYDPVIVVNSEGLLIGTVTIRQLLERASQLELETAQGANPLTGLPGNRSIERWLDRAVKHGNFTLIYADLDRFKEYNDCYGFVRGDDLIRLSAACLADAVAGRRTCQLGHIGGDDFVIVSEEEIPESTLEFICREFDRRKRAYFAPEDLERGFYIANDRQGDEVRVTPVTLSLAVMPRQRFESRVIHPARLSSAAASLKKKVKAMTAQSARSGYLVERRTHTANIEDMA